MGLKLSLTTKGLILVSVPLIFEIGFVAALLSFQQQASRSAAEAIKAREISARINDVAKDLYRMWHTFDSGKDRERLEKARHFFSLYRSTYVPLLKAARSEYMRLDELTTSERELNQAVKGALRALDSVQLILERAFADVHAGNLSGLMDQYQEGTDQLVDQFEGLVSKNFDLLSIHERLASDRNKEQHASADQQIVSLTVVACLLNAVFSIFLALFVVRDITSRIGTLKDNAQRVAASEPLNEPISGDDEIAALDKVFHRMSAAIDETARTRQEFVNMLTHDLRSPLTAMQGSLELLETYCEQYPEERMHRLITIAERNTSRMILLINDMLDVQRMKAGMGFEITSETVCAAEIFDDVSETMSAWMQEKDLKMVIKDTDLFVKADRQKLERIIINLVSNAIKYSPKEGKIILNAEEIGKDVRFSVADGGKGIPASQLDAIFGRFHQVKGSEKAGSSGLGLTICKYIVEAHGGRIWVESNLGQGATFYFTIPKA